MTARYRRGARKTARAKQRQGKKWVAAVMAVMVSAVAGWGFFSVGRYFQEGESGRITFIINSRPLLAASLNWRKGDLLLLAIPDTTMLTVSGGYGSYPAGSVWPLAQQEGSRAAIVTRSFQELLGIPVDYALDIRETAPNGDDGENPGKLVSAWIGRCIWGREKCGAVPKPVLVKTWLTLRKIPDNKVFYRSLEFLPGSRKEKLPDGSPVLGVETEGLDLLISRYAMVDEVRNEAVSVGLYNATGFPGLAKRAARLITNLGGRVLVLEDWGEKLAKCQLRADEETRNTRTYRLVKDLFGCEDGDREGETEVDLTVLLGEDYLSGL